jgi:uncharacterized protein
LTSKTASPGPGRLPRLDQLRGLAVLGILPVNILLFSGPMAALANPLVWGQMRGPNAVAWWLTHLLFEQKFLTLFCMIFGAGLVMQQQRWGEGPCAAATHRRRMAVLFVLGMIHAYVLWYGDILTPYAVCGLLLWPAARWRARRLFALGLLLLTIPPLLGWVTWFSVPAWSPQAIQSLERAWQPGLAQLLGEMAHYRGGWTDQMQQRIPQALFMQFQWFPLASGWRILGSMMIGMAATRAGLVGGPQAGGGRSWRVATCILGALGLAVTAWGAASLLQAGASPARAALLAGQPLYWGSLAMAWAYFLLFPRAGLGGRLGSSLECLGRTALSNYLLQSLVCAWIFYGSGLALFGQLQRWQVLLLALLTGAGQLALSRAWLGRFRQGPVEYLWRWASHRR